MTAGLTPTEAILSAAMAEDRVEILASRMALIETGPGAISQLDRSTLQAGDGEAGRHLLAETGWGPQDTCALRIRRIGDRLAAELAQAVPDAS